MIFNSLLKDVDDNNKVLHCNQKKFVMRASFDQNLLLITHSIYKTFDVLRFFLVCQKTLAEFSMLLSTRKKATNQFNKRNICLILSFLCGGQKFQSKQGVVLGVVHFLIHINESPSRKNV